MKSLNELTPLVLEWAKEKGILENGTQIKQAFKTLEECGELIQSVSETDYSATVDAIGDIVVTLIIQCEMIKQKTGIVIDLNFCLYQAYEEIKNRQGKMINGTFVKN